MIIARCGQKKAEMPRLRQGLRDSCDFWMAGAGIISAVAPYILPVFKPHRPATTLLDN
jgi:hypothetical protein